MKRLFNIEKAKAAGLPDWRIKQLEEANENAARMHSCKVHDFGSIFKENGIKSLKDYKKLPKKVTCKHCGGKMSPEYAGGYMDAVRDIKKQNREE